MNEWLETDGLGGFASGGTNMVRSRRYHAILLTATQPPTGRFVLVNGFDAWIITPNGRFAISSQNYFPEVIHPDGHRRIEQFDSQPWPSWTFLLEDGTRVRQEIVMRKGAPLTCVKWQILTPQSGVRLEIRPFFSGRDYHAMHHENSGFRFQPEYNSGQWIWKPYDGIPPIVVATNATYIHDAQWYRNFLYADERERGLDYLEDLASPGIFRWDLSGGPAACIFSTQVLPEEPVNAFAEKLFESERIRRSQFQNRLEFAADAYIVERSSGKTIVAGYPWFTDWGRDTFIAMRGLCLATGRHDVAGQILLQWAETVSNGMLPNRFPDQGSDPEYNSVDASLWYIIAVQEYLDSAKVSRADRATLMQAVNEIITGYQEGTRFGIRMDSDALLMAGQPGIQLTWMDAKIGDWVVTPRIGKPVEIQALWLNALRITNRKELFDRGLIAFQEKFWNERYGCLFDVIDVDHEPGRSDSSFRPNQIFAVGGLPYPILSGHRARLIVDAVENRLLTPIGLRSLAPDSHGYTPLYKGGVRERDSIYHQGVVWPWLLGPFVEAWIRVRGLTSETKQHARMRFLAPLLQHLDNAGIGHISEIADVEEPFTPRGCPFQAWSVGEALRLTALLK